MPLWHGRAMTKLAGKKTVITGAGSGIGRALALAAAERGAWLLLTDVNAATLDDVVGEVTRAGGRVLAARAFDVADFDAVQHFAREVEAAHGSVDVLVNNAGIAIWGRVESMAHADWRKVVDVNLMGPIHLIEAFVPGMIAARRGGHLVNVASAAGLFGLPWHAAYSASKFGLRGVSEVLRFDLERHRIRVSLVCPGGVDTGLVSTVKVAGADPSTPAFRRMRARFQQHAVSPERAASRILRGVERDHYMVYTSADIALGHWFQARFPWPYEQVMRALNRAFDRTLSAQEDA